MSGLDFLGTPAMRHAMSVHIPVALAMLGVPLVYLTATLCGLRPDRPEHSYFRWASLICYVLLTMSAWVAVQTGHGAYSRISPDVPQEIWDQVHRHEWLAEQVWKLAALTAAAIGASFWYRKWPRYLSTAAAMLLSIIAAGWVATTGHHGGHLVYQYGLGTPATLHKPAAPISSPPAQLEPASAADPPGAVSVQENPGPSSPIDMTAAQQVSYARDIQPILAEICYECHGDGELEGDYDCRTVTSLLKGGKKQAANIIPGDPDNSPIVKYLRGELRPQMPKGDLPLTPPEIDLFRMWIAAGAVDDSVGAN